MNAKRIFFAALIANATAACAMSTSYTPKQDGRVKLTVNNGLLALTKDGRTFTVEELFSALVVCDSEAHQYAFQSEQELKSGRDLLGAAGVLYQFGVTSPLGLVFQLMGSKDLADGQALLVDTINRHNDAKSCNRALGQTETKR